MVVVSINVEPALIIHLFGPFHVLCAGRPLPVLRSQKGQWLLTLLTLRHDRDIQRSWLAETLWPDVEQSLAFASLRPSLFDLRQALGTEAARILSPTPRTLRLELGDADVDVVAFDKAIARGSLEDLKQAVALYRGPLLEGCSEPWVHGERETRATAYIRALEKLATQALADGAYSVAADYLKRSIATNPLQQTAHRQLMQLLADAGEDGAALQVYHDLRHRLHGEYQIAPEDATTDLYRQIRTRARIHATKQTAPETPSQGNVANSNLPSPLTELVGRDQEVQSILAEVLFSRLVTLTGTGGIGKTRLAIQVAQEIQANFNDGVWFVSLETTTDPTLIPQRIATALGTPPIPGRSLTEALVSVLRTQQLLLILDNCEHLMEACAHLAGALLRGCPEVHILATSREKLGLTGETVRSIPPLTVPGSTTSADLSELQDFPAICLFCNRAVAARANFRLTPHNVHAVIQICRRLDGIPLAIELAAALVAAISIEDIAAHLDDRFHILSTGDRTAPERHQALKSTLDWSFHLLTPAERTLMRHVSTFAGGWTLEAAKALSHAGYLQISEVVLLLSRLVSKSLVVAEENQGSFRYRLLETIRAYTREQWCDPVVERRIQQVHCDYYLGFAETAEPELLGADQGTWLDKLELENDNFRAALDGCLREPPDPIAALRLAGALYRFWYTRGYHLEGQNWLERILEMPCDAPVAFRLKALRGAGNLAYVQGENIQAQVRFEECLILADKLGDKHARAATLASLANVETAEHNYSSARARFEESLSLFEELKDVRGVALTLGNLAMVACGEGKYADAQDLHLRALGNLKELQASVSIGIELNNLVHTLLKQGELDAIRPYLKESLALSQELQSPRLLAHCLTNSASLAVKSEYWEDAAVVMGAEEELRKRIHFPLPPAAQSDYQHDREAVCQRLGSDAFEVAMMRGCEMKQDALLTFLQSWLDSYLAAVAST
ncbi:MAG TPA: BTAD domain-containing putative transcriptional regulator [Chthonomonadaceae bacterium]|nr:BTAD domain-containing putative transcriptional regulator [Chthonomonadaceae bacterium]